MKQFFVRPRSSLFFKGKYGKEKTPNGEEVFVVSEPVIVSIIDPKTLKTTEVLTQTNTPEFGSGTVTVQVGKELWVGSFRGDRIAIFPAK